MNDPLEPDRCAELFAALSAPERLRIIRFLRHGPHNVTEIAEMLQTQPVNVAHHLGVLKHAGMVLAHKKGRFVYYSLPPGILENGDQPQTEFLNLGCCRVEMPSEQNNAETTS